MAYARFDAPGPWRDREVDVTLADGKAASGTVVVLPFYDAEKKIARGLPPDPGDVPDSNTALDPG